MKMSLNKEPVVEHRALGPTTPWFINLPFPISVNALFGQAPGRKRFTSKEYAAWQETAGMILQAQKPPQFRGQVWTNIVLQDTGNRDADNFPKAIHDLLVKHGVIEDDNRKILRGFNVSWGNVPGCRVEVRPYAFVMTGAC